MGCFRAILTVHYSNSSSELYNLNLSVPASRSEVDLEAVFFFYFLMGKPRSDRRL
jgi:hypothetical protein